MKKLISILVSLSVVFSLSTVPSFADNSVNETGEKDISTIVVELKERGFTDEFLSGFLDEELRDIHKNSDGYVVYISDNSDDIQLLSNDISSDDLDFSLSVGYYAKAGSSNIIDHLVIYCRYEWLANSENTLINPVIRGIDGITINWDASEFCPDSDYSENAGFIFRQYSRMSQNSTWTAYTPVDQPGQIDLGGLYYTFDLENNPGYFNRGVASFELYPKDGTTTLYISGSGTPNRSPIAATYGHSRSVLFPIQMAPNNKWGFTIDPSLVDSTLGTSETIKYFLNQ